jgi:hypothetical protein
MPEVWKANSGQAAGVVRMNYELEDNIILDNYEPAFSTFVNMLEKNHIRHGSEYKDKPMWWMISRVRDEEIECMKDKNTEEKICEAIDVAIMWLLIAQKHWIGAH